MARAFIIGFDGDIKSAIRKLREDIDFFHNIDDDTLDQMMEVAEAIRNNKNIIDSIAKEKVGYSDIVDSLNSEDGSKPLSARQGKLLKAYIENVRSLIKDNTLIEESDPTVPAWAKQASKPTYTASEVGADASGSAATVQRNLTAHKGEVTHLQDGERERWNSYGEQIGDVDAALDGIIAIQNSLIGGVIV